MNERMNDYRCAHSSRDYIDYFLVLCDSQHQLRFIMALLTRVIEDSVTNKAPAAVLPHPGTGRPCPQQTATAAAVWTPSCKGIGWLVGMVNFSLQFVSSVCHCQECIQNARNDVNLSFCSLQIAHSLHFLLSFVSKMNLNSNQSIWIITPYLYLASQSKPMTMQKIQVGISVFALLQIEMRGISFVSSLIETCYHLFSSSSLILTPQQTRNRVSEKKIIIKVSIR